MASWERVKAKLIDIEPAVSVVGAGVSVLGAIASMFIAVFAYQIDVRVQENALRAAQVDRAMALAQSILSDERFRDLQITAARIEADAIRGAASMTGAEPTDAWREAHVRAVTGAMDDRLRDQLLNLWRYVSQAGKCGQWVSDGPSGPMTLCHPSSMYVLTGDAFADLFLLLRPALACDPRFEGLGERMHELVTGYIDAQRANGIEPPALPPLDYGQATWCEAYQRELQARSGAPSLPG